MGKIELPDGGMYRIESSENNKVRIFYDQKVDGFRLKDKVVKVPADLSELTQQGTTKLINSMVHKEKEVACPFCEKATPMGEMRRHSFAGSVCQTCWDHCSCRECNPDDWKYKSSHSTRKSDKKTCPHCGQKFITSVATG